jgi:hypothetical protein
MSSASLDEPMMCSASAKIRLRYRFTNDSNARWSPAFAASTNADAVAASRSA